MMKQLSERTRRKHRLAICKDVLKQLKYLNVESGTYLREPDGEFFGFNEQWNCEKGDVDFTAKPKIAHKEASKFINKLRKCEVCALGSCMLSYVKLFNKISVVDVLKESSTYYPNSLERFFDKCQMQLIESYFEGTGYSGNSPFEFCLSVPNHKERLKLIMKNVVDNRGTFVPEKLKGYPDFPDFTGVE